MNFLTKISQILIILGLVFGVFCPNFSYASELVIQNLIVTNTTGDEVIINWSTNLHSYYLLEWGETTDYNMQVKGLQTELNHEIKLQNLKENTTYHFRIIAHTPNDLRTYTFDQTFKTKKIVDIDKPELIDFRIPLVTDSTAYIYITTNESASSALTYWEEGNQDKIKVVKKSSNSDRNTNYILKKLNPSTTYFYKLIIKDKDGNELKLSERSFHTEATSFQLSDFYISRVEPVDVNSPLIKDDNFTVKFTTTRPAYCSLHVGSRLIKDDSIYTWQHELNSGNLKVNTNYTYYISCKDYLGNGFTSKKYAIKTKGPIVLGFSTEEPIKPFNGKKYSLVKTANSPKVYAIIAGQKYYIKNPEIFKSYNLNPDDIKIISNEKLAKYPEARTIIRNSTGERFFLYLDKNMKKQLLTKEVDNSYSYNKKYQAIYVNETDFHSYQDLWLIKTPDSPAVYLIRNGVKRPIQSWDVFVKNNWKSWQIGQVNKTDLDSYITGSTIY